MNRFRDCVGALVVATALIGFSPQADAQPLVKPAAPQGFSGVDYTRINDATAAAEKACTQEQFLGEKTKLIDEARAGMVSSAQAVADAQAAAAKAKIPLPPNILKGLQDDHAKWRTYFGEVMNWNFVAKVDCPRRARAPKPAATRTSFRDTSDPLHLRGPLQWYVTMTGGLVNRNANATISRIKRSVIGVGEIPDVSNVKQNDVGATGELRIQIPVGAAASGAAADSLFCRELARRGLSTGCGSSLDMGYRYTGVDGSTAGAGPQIPVTLFTGQGVQGTAGNNSNPAGYSALNTAHTYGFHYEHRQHRFDAVFRVFGFDLRPSTVIQPIVGFRGMFTRDNDSFATNVTFPNGFPIDSLHTTNTDMLSGGLFAGVNLYHAPPGSPFVVIFGARGGFDVNRAESDVAFSIRTPNFFDLQQVTIKDSKTTPYVRVEGGIAANILGANVRSTIYVEQGGAFPKVEMPGAGSRPYIDFTNETNVGGSVTVRVPFSDFGGRRLFLEQFWGPSGPPL